MLEERAERTKPCREGVAQAALPQQVLTNTGRCQALAVTVLVLKKGKTSLFIIIYLLFWQKNDYLGGVGSFWR